MGLLVWYWKAVLTGDPRLCLWSQWESFQFLTIKYDVSCRVFVRILYPVEEVPPIPNLLRDCFCFLFFFIMGGCWILSFFLHLLICNISSLACWWYVTLIDFQMLNETCIRATNPTWLWWIILFTYCWIWFSNILLKIFTCGLERHWSVFFSVTPFLVLVLGCWWFYGMS